MLLEPQSSTCEESTLVASGVVKKQECAVKIKWLRRIALEPLPFFCTRVQLT